MQNNIDEARNLKVVLGAFEKLSSLKINFYKSELFFKGSAGDRSSIKKFTELFGCKEGSLPFCYLGMPMYFHMLSNKDGNSVEEHFVKKCLVVGKENSYLPVVD